MTLLSYFVLPDRTFAFVITKNSFHAFDLKVREEDLNRQVTWFRRFADLSNNQSETLQELYRELIEPLKAYLKTPKVCIVPHRELHYLPFAALLDGRAYFGDEHLLSYIPSASSLPFIHKREKPMRNKMLAISQSKAPKLPLLTSVDDEVDAVATIYNTRAFKTGGATKSWFLNHASQYDLILIAAHTQLDNPSPLFDKILFAKDETGVGAVEIRDIYNLDLTRTNLIVLSACQTEIGGGEHRLGDDLVALNRAFIYAGAPSVMASLWMVNDEATNVLIKSFYKHLRQGTSKVESLQAAQRETRMKYKNPYYWAAFVLTGDPGRNLVRTDGLRNIGSRNLRKTRTKSN